MINTRGKLLIICVLVCLVSLNTARIGVRAQPGGAIVINADGSIWGTSLIQRQGNIYSLAGNIYDMPITVSCSNIVLDGEGFALQGAGGWGTPGVAGLENSAAIDLACSNVTVRDFDIWGWETGVAGAYDGNAVTDNNISRTENAIAIYADKYIVNCNSFSDSIYGVYIKGSNNFVSQNQIAANYCGIMIYPTIETTVTENNFTGNEVCLTIGTYDNFSYQIYDNNFIIKSNSTVVETTSDALGPSDTGTLPPWDNGSIGNYWSDYSAMYPNAAQVDNSSIGNTPYLIRTNPTVIDRYPLMTPASPRNTNQSSSFETTNDDSTPPFSKAEPESSQSLRSRTIEFSFATAAIISVASCIVVLAFRNKLFWLK
ncbi:MAG: NosD domain-containing protein [Candidatus Bathyarchaeia archaeon]